MAKLYIAKKNGKWCSDRAHHNHRPTFYRNSAALFQSAFAYWEIPLQIQEAISKEDPKLEPFSRANTITFYKWTDLYAKYVKANKITTKQLLQMFQDDGIIEVFEIDEEEMLNTYLQSKNLI